MGVVILKDERNYSVESFIAFQSPQWGDNSKVEMDVNPAELMPFQSPQWGDNSKGYPLESA